MDSTIPDEQSTIDPTHPDPGLPKSTQRGDLKGSDGTSSLKGRTLFVRSPAPIRPPVASSSAQPNSTQPSSTRERSERAQRQSKSKCKIKRQQQEQEHQMFTSYTSALSMLLSLLPSTPGGDRR